LDGEYEKAKGEEIRPFHLSNCSTALNGRDHIFQHRLIFEANDFPC
jgi:hypothetical protein